MDRSVKVYAESKHNLVYIGLKHDSPLTECFIFIVQEIQSLCFDEVLAT